MSHGRKGALVLALFAALGLAATGCGEEETSEVVEGEPLELGELAINVQLTRLLNPNDREDREYLEGQQVPPPAGKDYLAVFVEIENEGDEQVQLPTADEVEVIDTTGRVYHPLPSDTVFALDLGGTLGPHEELPLEDTAAQSGPTQGSIVLFLVDDDVGENRPLELEFTEGGEVEGQIELDI
ncbi:MAG: hypothetical protein ACRDL6_06120 [Solirubrobacterales bacterium]